jgi:hypothetical protein
MEKKMKLAEGHEDKQRHTAKEVEGPLAAFVSSPQVKVTAGVVGAGVAGLIAAAFFGVGPAAIAGAAGYLAYRGMTGKPA